MYIDEMKSIAAQYCDNFVPQDKIIGGSMLAYSQTCSNCSNFSNGKCKKELLQKIQEKIKFS